MYSKKENNESLKSSSVMLGFSPNLYSPHKNINESKKLINNSNNFAPKSNDGKNQTKINYNNIINLNINCRKYNNNLEGFLNNYNKTLNENKYKNNIKSKANRRNNFSKFDNVFNNTTIKNSNNF